MPSGSKSYHTCMGIRVDLPQEHEPHTALHLRLIPGGTTARHVKLFEVGEGFSKNHVEERWRFVVGVLLLKRNTKTPPYPAKPILLVVSFINFHQPEFLWPNLSFFGTFNAFNAPKKDGNCTWSWNDAMHKGCCACRSSTSPSVPVGKHHFRGPRFEGGSKNNLWTHAFSIYRRLRWSFYHPCKNYHHNLPYKGTPFRNFHLPSWEKQKKSKHFNRRLSNCSL